MGLCTRIQAVLKGFLIFSALMMYQSMSFLALVSLSIGISVATTKFYDYLMFRAFPNWFETCLSMYLISMFAKFHIFCQNECIGAALTNYNRAYHNMLTYVAIIIYTATFIFSFGQLYIQFEAVHIKKYTSTAETVENVQLHTALFLLALAYIVYCTSKLIYYGTLQQIRVKHPFSCVQCIVTVAFVGVHMVINVLYSIPLMIVAFSLKTHRNPGSSSFVPLNFTAALSGVVFAVIETRKPWPTKQNVGPFFLYENNSRAKHFLGKFQIIWILIFFYGPLQWGSIKESEFNAGNDSVLYFCFAVAFNVLHLVKSLVSLCIRGNAFQEDVEARGQGEVEGEAEVILYPSNDNIVGQFDSDESECFYCGGHESQDNRNTVSENPENDNNNNERRTGTGLDKNENVGGQSQTKNNHLELSEMNIGTGVGEFPDETPRKCLTSPAIFHQEANPDTFQLQQDESSTKVKEDSIQTSLTQSEAKMLSKMEKVIKASCVRKPFPVMKMSSSQDNGARKVDGFKDGSTADKNKDKDDKKEQDVDSIVASTSTGEESETGTSISTQTDLNSKDLKIVFHPPECDRMIEIIPYQELNIEVVSAEDEYRGRINPYAPKVGDSN